MEVDSSSFYAIQFLKALREHSQNKQDPISEWILLESVSWMEDGGKCICTKEIKNIFKIQNKITKEVLEIGGDCAGRWLNPSLNCFKCDCVLGNVIQRRKDGFYLCLSCKRKAGKLEDRTILYDSQVLSFYELAQKEGAVEWLANHPKTQLDKLFLEYCSYFYKFA